MRKEQDSNLRTAFDGYTLSRRPLQPLEHLSLAIADAKVVIINGKWINDK